MDERMDGERMSKKFTDEMLEQAAEMWAQGIGMRDIAKALGVTQAALSMQIRRARHMFPYRRIPNVTPYMDREIDAMRDDGMTLQEIADELDLNKDSVSRRINNRHETKFDEERYRRVLSLLEEAVQLMSEWGCR